MKIDEFKSKLVENGYCQEQIDEIVLGIENDIDVSVYSKLEYDASQMREIRLGLMHNLYVSEYSDPSLSSDQMWIKRHVMEYSNKPNSIDGSFRHMVACYVADMLGIPESVYKPLSSDHIFVLIDGAREHIDVTDVPLNELDAEQMYEILHAREGNLDDQKLLRRQSDGAFMPAMKMREIRIALSADIDLLEYATPDHSASQLREIRFGLEESVNTEVYSSIDFSAAQMKQIRLGMQVGVDVSVYADADKYSAGIMRVIRHGLTEGVHPSAYLNDKMSVNEAASALQSVLNRNENVHDSDGDIELNADYLSRIITNEA